MWDNPRLLNLVAGFLVGLAALAFAFVATMALLRSKFFPVREVVVANRVHKTAKAEIEGALRGRITGNFFAVSLGAVRAALEGLPWVRQVAVRRVWPDQLEVTLEEHVALARWGDDSLVNTHGEKFPGRTSEPLPQFIGPAGSEGEVARRYERFVKALAPIGAQPERVVLTARYAWQLRLTNGLQLMLGRDADLAEQRLTRFVAVYEQTLGRIPRRPDTVDLRYPNGFALRVPEGRS